MCIDGCLSQSYYVVSVLISGREGHMATCADHAAEGIYALFCERYSNYAIEHHYDASPCEHCGYEDVSKTTGIIIRRVGMRGHVSKYRHSCDSCFTGLAGLYSIWEDLRHDPRLVGDEPAELAGPVAAQPARA